MNVVTLDFETFYGKGYSLSSMTNEEYINDPKFEVIGVSVKINNAPAVWFSGTFHETKAWLLSITDWSQAFLVCHHTHFDGAILAWRFGIVPKFYACTMSMARPFYQHHGGVSLKNIAEKLGLGKKGDEVVRAFGKRRIDFTPHELKAYGGYCINDTELTYQAFKKLRSMMPMEELRTIDLMIRMYTQPSFTINVDLLTKHLAAVQARKQSLLGKCFASKDDLMSNEKFAAVLNGLGVEPPMKQSLTAVNADGTPKMTYAFSKKDVEFNDLLDHPNPDVQAVVAARLGVKSTLEETRTIRLINVAQRNNGLLPIYLVYYGAHTGRASGGDKINMQNNGRGSPIRDAMEAPPGHVVVAGDSAQIEARVVAWVAEQDDLVADFENKVDIYSSFASDVYGYKVNRKWTVINAEGKEEQPHKLEGHVGKTCILGLGFGMGPPKFQHSLATGSPRVVMELGKCKDIVYNVYRKKYAKIASFWKVMDGVLSKMHATREFKSDGYCARFGRNHVLKARGVQIILPNGMPVTYNDLQWDAVIGTGDNAYVMDGFSYAQYKRRTKVYGGKATENVVQALARIVVFSQMVKAKEWLDKAQKYLRPGEIARVVLTVHDEIVCIVPERLRDWCKKMLEQVMSVRPEWGPDLPIACEVGTGYTYGDAK